MRHDILMLLKTFPPSFSRLFISEDLFQWPFSMFFPDGSYSMQAPCARFLNKLA